MRKKNGFSLIELLAAIIIMGLILLVVIPATARLLTSNDAKEYNNYFKIIETGAKVYADDKRDDLGSSNDIGCIEVTIEELINEEYIKPFDDEKVTCSGTVRLENNQGNLSVSTNVTCVNEKGEETFKEENIEESTCVAFKPKDDDGLKDQIERNGVGTGSISTFNNKQYITGSNPNNYVWYSGKLWRVVYYNDNEVKLISMDIATVIPRNTIKYANSSVDKWLREVYLPTLKDYDKYLVSTTWDVSPTDTNYTIPSGSETITSQVGLLNTYEAARMGTYMGTTYRWILSNYYSSSNKLRTNTKGGGGTLSDIDYSSIAYYAIRPAVTMKPGVYVIGGNGSSSNPYILEGNSTNIPSGTLLNTRYSGEYLKINNSLYRIVRTSNNLTKVIMVESLASQLYSDKDTNNFSYSNIYDYLKNTWYQNNLGSDKKLVYENGSWCQRTVLNYIQYTEMCSSDTFTSPVGLPSLGDVYTANNDGKTDTFWTIDSYYIASGYGSMNVITTNNSNNENKVNKKLTETARIKPVMYLKSNVIITDGNGTSDDPFILDLK